ncbi:hypothetical protein Bhyg_04760 [Pseudolycoriella hygida]|uniref:Uncharacterized protein n=1 Tax=Pseudolycoriella hygida TaxID=35572 RepID=A0A9Q0S8M3_9DIPT|nr:hypothetical protein Bhyg_04760 [Pseudolycoriella hygida]
MGFVRYIFTFALIAALVNGDQSDETQIQDANKPATLKPLTRIAGTDVFLNTLYKWHDGIRPGCFVTSSATETKELRMVCNKDDQKWYDNPASDWIFEIPPNIATNFDSVRNGEYNGTLAIKNVGPKGYVDSKNFLSFFWPLNNEENLFVDTADIKTKSSMNYGRFGIHNEGCAKNTFQIDNNRFDAAHPDNVLQSPLDNHRSSLYLSNAGSSCTFSFVPALKVDVNIYNFRFARPPGDELAKHTSQKSLIDSFTAYNNNSAASRRIVTVSEKITNEFSWGLSQSFSIGTKLKGKAGIPFVAEGEVETSFDFEVGANQDWSTKEEKSFQMSYEVGIAPNSQVEISAWYDLIKGLSMEYTATFDITGRTSRVSVFDDVVDDTPASGLMIRQHLEYSNFDAVN